MNHPEEIERLVVNTSPIGNHNNNTINETETYNSRPNSQPIPANRLALDAQIQAAAQYQRRLRQKRRIYYILLITCFTMCILLVLTVVAWIIHNSTTANAAQPQTITLNPLHSSNANMKSKFNENKFHTKNIVIDEVNFDVGGLKGNHLLNAKSLLRPSPTRTDTTDSEGMVHLLVKRSDLDSDEDKDKDISIEPPTLSKEPTRTHKISFRPEKIVDPMPRFRPIV